MRAPDGSDAHVCGLRFYADWRMHLVFGENNEIVVSWVGQHTDAENPHVDGAVDLPQLAEIGVGARISLPAAMSSTKHPSTKRSST
jgi:hypothetical protein